MTSNYDTTKQWFQLAYNNIKRVIRNYEQQDYADTIFRIQLSIEQLQKGLLGFLGVQFRKNHKPSKILDSIIHNSNIKLENKKKEIIKNISLFAKEIEKEETFTRYGIKYGGRIIAPEEYYDKKITLKYISNLKEILNLLILIFDDVLGLELEIEQMNKYKKRIEELEEK
ncbi:MAG TPA: HEPN domain-containing protein [Candidatus Lokiarchaeia archaeon]